jgi:crotonobetaine/carnitine-CoA ligase
MRAAYLDVLPALLVGGSVVVAPRFSASRFWRDLVEHDVTVFSLIGTVMRILWQREPEPAEREHRVRLTWGGPITVEPADFERRFGVRVMPGRGVYGMSEIGMLCMTSDDPATSGRVRPPYEVRIASPAGDELPAGETGEVLVRPREPGVVFDGYLHQPEATIDAWRGLWFHTGDLGRVDGDGRFEFVGRRKEMIRRAGHNIAAAEVEEALAGHADVAEAAAIGLPAPLGEELLVVLVVPRAGAAPGPAELVAHCAARLAAFAVPDRCVLVPALPKTPTGKVARAELAALAASLEEAP